MAASADPEIVVIGCGISGVAAAHRLVSAGFHHVRILEATARSGGRIKSGRLGERHCCSSFCVIISTALTSGHNSNSWWLAPPPHLTSSSSHTVAIKQTGVSTLLYFFLFLSLFSKSPEATKTPIYLKRCCKPFFFKEVILCLFSGSYFYLGV